MKLVEVEEEEIPGMLGGVEKKIAIARIVEEIITS